MNNIINLYLGILGFTLWIGMLLLFIFVLLIEKIKVLKKK